LRERLIGKKQQTANLHLPVLRSFLAKDGSALISGNERLKSFVSFVRFGGKRDGAHGLVSGMNQAEELVR
jgi:hypothetical protein